MPKRTYDFTFHRLYKVILSLHLNSHDFSNLRHILVSTTTHIDHNILIFGQSLRQLNCVVNSMTRLKSGNDTLVFAHHFESLQGLIIGDSRVFGPSTILQESVLGTNTGIVQTSTDTVCIQCLATFLLNDISESTLQHTRSSLSESGTVLLILIDTMTGGLHTVQFYSLVLDKWVESSDRVRSSSDTSNYHIREFSSPFKHLRPHLDPHDTLKVTNNSGERVWPDGRPN
mmetsp:Transcript_29198/g.58248  ORF Transcript_29198/g.58248 Transcript_29198/m.58248 type:complete len:229 (-) Transcript_29198:1871-2557(-)